MCAGTPDTIASGCPTVLIGTGGGGGGGGGGAGKAGGEARADEGKGGKGDSGKGDSGKRSEVTTKATEDEMEEGEDHFLDVRFVDKGGFPITGTRYSIKTPEGKRSEGNLVGAFKKTGVKEGDYEIELKAITRAEWSKKEAEVGEKVKLIVETTGIENGEKATLQIYIKDSSFADRLLKTISTEVKSDKIEEEWELKIAKDLLDVQDEKSSIDKYSTPLFVFEVQAGGQKQRSGLLQYKDWIELKIKDAEGKSLANKKFKLYFPNGEIREGTLDSNGYAKVGKIPPGKFKISIDPRK